MIQKLYLNMEFPCLKSIDSSPVPIGHEVALLSGTRQDMNTQKSEYVEVNWLGREIGGKRVFLNSCPIGDHPL